MNGLSAQKPGNIKSITGAGWVYVLFGAVASTFAVVGIVQWFFEIELAASLGAALAAYRKFTDPVQRLLAGIVELISLDIVPPRWLADVYVISIVGAVGGARQLVLRVYWKSGQGPFAAIPVAAIMAVMFIALATMTLWGFLHIVIALPSAWPYFYAEDFPRSPGDDELIALTLSSLAGVFAFFMLNLALGLL